MTSLVMASSAQQKLTDISCYITAVLMLFTLAIGKPAAAGQSEEQAKQLLDERQINGAAVQTVQFYSRDYHIDRIYRSMEGPAEVKVVSLLPDSKERLWVVGVSAEILPVTAEGELEEASSTGDYMCHLNLDHPDGYGRILTLSQGVYSVALPPGFGMPIAANTKLNLNTQVLNLNEAEIDQNVRYRISFDYVRDQDLKQPMQALFSRTVFGLKRLAPKPGSKLDKLLAKGKGEPEGQTCLPGQHASNSAYGSTYDYGDGFKYSGHWQVEPGEELNRTVVTQQLYLSKNSKIHYAVPHVHPFAEYVELYNKTTGETLFRLEASNTEDKIGLSNVTSFTSEAGLPINKKHEYQLISYYNNTTGVPQDSMATIMLFMDADMAGVKY